MDYYNPHEWKIHKTLKEAKRVYICPARGNCKPERTLRMYEELLEEGKEIVLVRSADIPKKDSWKGRRALLDLDKDLICNSEYQWMQDAIDKYIEEEMKKSLQEKNDHWTPKVYMDTSLINPRDLYTKQLTVMDSVLGSFIVASEGE